MKARQTSKSEGRQVLTINCWCGRLGVSRALRIDSEDSLYHVTSRSWE